MADHNVQPPLFSTVDLSANALVALASRGNPATFNLDDIFGDVAFTPDGETVFVNTQESSSFQADLLNSGEGSHVAAIASKPTSTAGQYAPIPKGGGVYTTQLMDPTKPALVHGAAGPGIQQVAPVPFTTNPQMPNHMQFATSKKRKSGVSNSSVSISISASAGAGVGSRPSDRRMSDQQKVERRERNREHAKRSRIRKKFLLESLQHSVVLLKDENENLRKSLRSHLGEETAEEIMSRERTDRVDGLIATSSGMANKVLDDPDFSFIKALQTAQQNFVVTDPSLPDNPIVYASQGFLNLTGYSLDQILGRNCRFLQGPETDPKATERIRKAIEQGNDMSVCLLNYRVDGTTFWNQFFIAPLRDAAGNVTNFVGVQCKVSDQYAATVIKQQEEEDEAAEGAAMAAEEDDDEEEAAALAAGF